MKMVKSFVSYSSLDKKLAGRLKKALEEVGFEVFLAHDDITPSKKWLDHIQKVVKTVDVFLPLLTENYVESDWVDQETGMALAQECLIIPLSVDVLPYGFISGHQTLWLKPSEGLSKPVEGILATVYDERPGLRRMLLEGVIKSFADSNNFYEARDRAPLLLELKGYSKRQLNRLLVESTENRQIYQSTGARSILYQMVERYKSKMDVDLIEKFNRTR